MHKLLGYVHDVIGLQVHCSRASFCQVVSFSGSDLGLGTRLLYKLGGQWPPYLVVQKLEDTGDK